MKTVFLSYPFRSDPTGNRRSVEIICQAIAEKYPDVVLVVPQLYLYKILGYEQEPLAMKWCLKLLEQCDEVWFCNVMFTVGMQEEWEHAYDIMLHGKPVMRMFDIEKTEVKD